jgi:Iap family predicted aminopeptidase
MFRAGIVAAIAIGGFMAARAPAQIEQQGASVSSAELQKSLDALNLDRTSGTDGERKAAAYLEAKLQEYEIPRTRYDVRAFLSWPVKADLSIVGSDAHLAVVTPAFGASTPPAGTTASVYWPAQPGGPPARRDAAGKFLVAEGLVSPESVLAAQDAGAAGLIHINETDTLHEMIATTIWGTPTPGSAPRLPRIPVVSMKRSDAARLRSALSAGDVRLRIVTDVERGWRSIPLVVADLPGGSPDFILVATHLDSWYRGMTDTAGTVASVLEMARVLQTQLRDLRRGVRFAWWPGHSFGRYAGSAWYADRFWADLDRHCVAYMNLDGAGRRGSRLDAVYAGGWPGLAEFSREFAQALTGKIPPTPSPAIFRPGRDSDSSFQGIGIPEFAIGVPGPSRGAPDVDAAGRIAYWHTPDDTIDKLDLKALELDTRYRVAQIHRLATLPVLPHRIAPIVESYVRAIDELANIAGKGFDLATARDAAVRLREAAARVDAAAPPVDHTAIESRNQVLVRLTHRLNSMLYTKAGRFDQDPAMPLPILPLLDPVRELVTLAPDSDGRAFLETELLRARNAVQATLREALEDIERHLKER